MTYLLVERREYFKGRRNFVLPLSLVAGLVFLGMRLYKWWNEYCELREDEHLFGEAPEPLLLSSGAAIPLPASNVRHVGKVEHSSGVLTQEERSEALRLARALLDGATPHDVSYGELEEDSDSVGTDVSLNYHIAVELEREARDNLIEAVVQGEVTRAASQGRPPVLADYSSVLPLVVEYFEISKDREELRRRRAAKRLKGTQNGGLGSGSGSGQCGPGDLFNDAHEIGQRLAQMRPADVSTAYADLFSRSQEMERLLRAPANDRWDECMEVGWGGEDEADLMAYLEQDDSAGFSNRAEARAGARLQRDLRILEDDEMYDDISQGAKSEDLDDELEKANFERMLLSKLHSIAESVDVVRAGFGRYARSRQEGGIRRPEGEERNQRDVDTGNTRADHAHVSGDADDDSWETEDSFEED